jgi:hypothetical protein
MRKMKFAQRAGQSQNSRENPPLPLEGEYVLLLAPKRIFCYNIPVLLSRADKNCGRLTKDRRFNVPGGVE